MGKPPQNRTTGPGDRPQPLSQAVPRARKSLGHERRTPAIETFAARIGTRTANLFKTRQLMCSEAVLAVLNQVLKGGLPPAMAIRLGSGFPEGLGGSGCTCGALTGAIMGLGLFLGRSRTGFRNGRNAMEAAGQIHAFFKTRFGATCCRVLVKGQERGSAAHWEHCAVKVGQTAERAALLILDRRPELLESAECSTLDQKETVIKTRLKQIANTIGALNSSLRRTSAP